MAEHGILSKHFGAWGSSEMSQGMLDMVEARRLAELGHGYKDAIEEAVAGSRRRLAGQGGAGKPQEAKTRHESYDLTQIPFDVLRRMGAVAREAEPIYGRNNWRKAVYDKKFQLERLNHAAKHLFIAIHALEFGETLGEPGEDDMAKVLVNVSMVMELLRLEAVSQGETQPK